MTFRFWVNCPFTGCERCRCHEDETPIKSSHFHTSRAAEVHLLLALTHFHYLFDLFNKCAPVYILSSTKTPAALSQREAK